MYETDDPEQFLRYLDDLTALGGGDEPEMCFTAIQVTMETLIYLTPNVKWINDHH